MSKKLVDRLHALVAILTAWLIFTSPWVVMLRKFPAGAGFMDYAHVGLGSVALLASLAYLVATLVDGGWRLYFPWLSGDVRPVGRDLAGLARGRIPSAEGGGLFAVIEGLLLAAFLGAAATGAGWFLAQGAPVALAWRDWHIALAWTTGALAAVHVVTVSLHVLDFVRD